MKKFKSETNIISIVIPFYNTEKKLYTRCLDSILDNNFQNLEVLVIDDGSSDEYHSILNYRADDSRLRIIYNAHSGPSAARNLGIREAAGHQIMFVDSDDFLNSEIFGSILENNFLYKGDVNIFFGGKYKNGKYFSNDSILTEGYNYGSLQQDKIYIMQSALSIGNYPEEHIQYFSLGAPYCKLIKKDFLLKNNLKFNEFVKFAEDVLFMLDVYLHAESIYYHEKYLYNYVSNSESATKKFRPELSKDMNQFFEEMYTFLQKNKIFPALEKAYYARVEYEVGRCFRSEFYHYKNKDKTSDEKFDKFCKKEPYSSALKYKYLPKKRIKLKILFFFINNKMGYLYKFLSGIYFKYIYK